MLDKHKLIKKAEKAFSDAGKQACKPIHARMEEIIRELQKTFPQLKEFWAGMGTYFFNGDDFPVIYDDGEKGMDNVRNFLEYAETNKVCIPEGYTERHRKLCSELIELADFLEDERYTQLFELR